MLDLKILQNSEFFKKRTLESKEYLFKEGDFDENIYIILVGELEIEKYTSTEKNETKILATLKKDEIFGEASLNNNLEKQVSIKAKRKSELLYIKSKDIEKFAIESSKQAFNLLKYIIHLSNNRLNIANELITSSYKISKEIINLKDFSYKTIFELIEKIKSITRTDEEIIYIEENPVLKEYLVIKYRTTQKSVMQNEVIKITDNKLNLLDLKISGKHSYIQKLQIGEKNYGYLIFIKNNSDFSDSQIKILSTISTSLAGVLKQKEYLQEQKNIDYIKNR